MDFLAWLKQMGCPKTKLTLAEFSNTGRGMMATKSIKVNQDLLKRPIEYEEYEWAWLVVNTRCIYLDAKKQDTADNIALAPMLDFLNHTHDAKTEGFFCTKTKSYKIKTLLPYKKGEQVFINYGPHDNCFILVEYGFVTPDNPYNYALLDNDFLQLDIPGENPTAKKDKVDLLTASGYFADYALHRNDVSFRLMVAMRLRLINPFLTSSVATQLEIAKWHNVIGGELDQISPENERKVPEYIEILCDRLLLKAKQSLSALARKPTSFPVMHLQQIWTETRDIALSVIDKIHRKEQL
ncbi:SET domain-containing protein 4 [Mortierella sp. AM989]|nr:SET domain-containing protein 4 [Mortierella sp. AM989]